MPPEDINFQSFLAAKLKDRALSIKKLAELTGIAPGHLEALVHGRFDDLPSAPYVRGYLVRIGGVLDFDGEEWWGRIKKERLVANSGPADTLPNNRFIKQSPKKFIWIGVAVALVIIYLAFQVPVIFGHPGLSVTFPSANPYTTGSSTLTLTGTTHGADSLFLSNGSNGDNENITITPDGSWQKSVLLQNGPNTFQITAKKLLGGEANITEQIIYQGPVFMVPTSTASSSPSSSPNATGTSAGFSATSGLPAGQ